MIIHGKIKRVRKGLFWVQLNIKRFVLPDIPFVKPSLSYVRIKMRESDLEEVMKHKNMESVDELEGMEIKMHLYGKPSRRAKKPEKQAPERTKRQRIKELKKAAKKAV